MRYFNSEKLYQLQKNLSQVRNICILAHVDHGKTTLADSLVATNGVISPKMAGKLRYMDSRKDEQERGITMKSSSIALMHSREEQDYLINMIDSPGHVDFSSEVSTAVRLCDGAIVVVDVVEGVCPQTKVALRQAWLENIQPVLVLNKIDRLILELKLSPIDAYVHLAQVLEQINAVMGELFMTEVMGKTEAATTKTSTASVNGENNVYDWSTGLEDEDDSNLYFAPERGNVIFASAIDGWGFRVEDFAKIFAVKLGVSESVLKKTLWGDFYLQSKTKRILKGATGKAKKPLFVQFVLENLWDVYETIVVRKDKVKLLKIVASLNITLTARDLRHTDGKVQLQAVCSQWLPLAKNVLDMVCTQLPSPNQLTKERAEKLMCSAALRFDSLPSESQALRSAFVECSCSDEAPLIVFISKMIPVERKLLPENRPQPLTEEVIKERREAARRRHAEKLEQPLTMTDAPAPEVNGVTAKQTESNVNSKEKILAEDNENVFIAFARVFSGTIKKGQDLYVLGPKHNPQVALERLQAGFEIDEKATLKDLTAGHYITRTTISHLYLLMGRDLELLEEVPAGNIVGIGGLEDHVLKTATLSSNVACPPFTELMLMAVPILRVSVEPVHPADMPALKLGLRLLNQADACVQVVLQETGELVLVTAGEVHLQRCLDDLRERYAKVDINVSEPIVPFRETVVPPPTVDMVNEAIQDQASSKKTDCGDEDDGSVSEHGVVSVWTSNRQSVIRIRAAPLPAAVTTILEKNSSLLKVVDKYCRTKSVETEHSGDSETSKESISLTDRTLQAIEEMKTELAAAFEEGGAEWEGALDQMWSVGPRRCGPNVLLNRVAGYGRPPMWEPVRAVESALYQYDSSFVNGFQLAALAGPLCEEPMMGVCFVVEGWTLAQGGAEEGQQPFGPLSGQIMSAVKEGCRRAFQAQPQRLMLAMYSCHVQVNADVLGRMYAVLGRRHGRVLHGDALEGSASFGVTAVLPVAESFSFAPEMLKQTSGLASPQLVFSHWEVLDVDPFWAPTTEEEYLHFGEKADSGNRARRYVEAVRRRKGLSVEAKIVEFAEKQRTLSRKK
ncbi:elongation factor-like GTPase 1 [Bacillus rossius redtenbacheri]|uniref:elongation factor-like GTPase 1 n=1 Tax=Bacillus rossius redtenbacheri TaxID=93214 RepID=UPI002FDCEEDA